MTNENTMKSATGTKKDNTLYKRVDRAREEKLTNIQSLLMDAICALDRMKSKVPDTPNLNDELEACKTTILSAQREAMGLGVILDLQGTDKWNVKAA